MGDALALIVLMMVFFGCCAAMSADSKATRILKHLEAAPPCQCAPKEPNP